ncbi:MAG: ABC transporter ATP-binding protein [Tissierellia bacterium]|jgi:ATP-binding cassette subfamily B protein|nr:ABC transporter ATP-binding protein [Tissierellia bacterium]
MKSFKTLSSFFKEHKWSYLIGVVWLIIIDLVQLLVPQIIRNLANDYESNILNNTGLIKYALYIVLTGLIIGFGRYFWRIYILGTSRTLEYYLRKRLFNHLLTLSPNYFNINKTGDLMAHATNDINAVRQALGHGIILIVDSGFMILFGLTMMVRTTSLRLTAIVVFTLPLVTFIVIKFGKIIYSRFKIVQEAFSNLTDITQESFAGIRVTKSFVQEDLVSENFSKLNDANFQANLNLVKISGTFHPLLRFVASISLFIVIFYASKEVILDRISLGDFLAFNLYLGSLIWPTMALGMVVNVLQRGAASMDRLNIIFKEESEIKEIDNPIVIPQVKGDIEFDNVSFKYPNTDFYALNDINFRVKIGETLALVGRTGSGKTTIVSLLLRLYDISEGTIYLDGVNIKDISLNQLRESIAYVPQDDFLFSQTLAENISFGIEGELSEEKIIKASKDAEIYDNIMDFPKKFETVLGERGVTLSGGQKQRSSIARALIKQSPILILDDSLSAVDTETEEKILNNLKNMENNPTTIIISHRISTINHADQILYLEDGRIIERGTHEELLELKGQYNNLNEKQLLEEKLSKEGEMNE